MTGGDNHTVRPAKARATVSEEGGELRIVMQVPRNWPLFAFLTFWLVLWICGGLFALLALFTVLATLVAGGGLPPWSGFLLIWLVGWAAGLALGAYEWVRVVGGREVLLISGAGLVMRREASRYAQQKRFALGEVHDLAVYQDSWTFSRLVRFGAEYWFWTGGRLAFEHGGKIYRIGTYIGEAEAKHLISLILQRFPSLAPKEPS